MQIVAMAEANPAPSVKFHWINETMQIVKYPINVHPFVYRTVFELKNISSYFCGKNLTTEFTNIKGSSGVVETFIDLNGKFEKESPLQNTMKFVPNGRDVPCWEGDGTISLQKAPLAI